MSEENEIKEYVLVTAANHYFVEYLLKELIISDCINDAMKFSNKEIADKFKNMLYDNCYMLVEIFTIKKKDIN